MPPVVSNIPADVKTPADYRIDIGRAEQEHLLKLNTWARPISIPRVQTYAQLMVENLWPIRDSGPYVLGNRGAFYNGQHRVIAALLAGYTIRGALLVVGEPELHVNNIDMGRQRRLVDMLCAMGAMNPHKTIPTVSVLHRMCLPKKDVSQDMIRMYAYDHREILQTVIKKYYGAKLLRTSSNLTAVVFLCHLVNANKMAAFADALRPEVSKSEKHPAQQWITFSRHIKTGSGDVILQSLRARTLLACIKAYFENGSKPMKLRSGRIDPVPDFEWAFENMPKKVNPDPPGDIPFRPQPQLREFSFTTAQVKATINKFRPPAPTEAQLRALQRRQERLRQQPVQI